MLKPVVIIVAILGLLGFLGYRAYQRYSLHKFDREFTPKYFGPHPKHPVFGTIKGFANGWEFYAPLPTAGLNTSQVQFTIEDDPNSIHVQNYESLRAKWPTVWPLIFAALKKVMAEYGYSEVLASATPKLSVSIPDERFGDDTKWSVNLEFEPFGGIYDVQMRGWTEIYDSGAAF